nr:S-ribosylhomocysteine lyase [uncultured Dubosiella sp.]
MVGLMKDLFTFMAGFEGEVPGASPKDCGNYLDMNLPMAKFVSKRFLDNVLTDIDESRLIYPQ